MAGKISTLILTIDLNCGTCYKQTRETIFKLKDREQIQTFTFNAKNNTITISGFFDPQKLKKLLWEAPKLKIKEIEIKEEDKQPPILKETKPPEKPNPNPPEKPEEKPMVSENSKESEKPTEPEKPKQPELENEKPEPPEPNQGNHPVWPAGPSVPCCCWRPCYERYYGGCRCCCCGKFNG